MKSRCANKNHHAYKDYGGRGIDVRSRWRDNFAMYFADTGPNPKGSGLSVDRIDNDGGYWCGKPECGDCGPLGREKNWRRVSRKSQMNNRRSCVIVSYGGVSKTLSEWARDIGISPNLMSARYRAHGAAEKIFSPKKKPKKWNQSLKSQTRRIWYGMIQRCHNKDNPSFKNYGAKGTSVCERWLSGFENFIADMGIRPDKLLSLDRIDPSGNYEPSNCRWATKSEQMSNRRRPKTRGVAPSKMPLPVMIFRHIDAPA